MTVRLTRTRRISIFWYGLTGLDLYGWYGPTGRISEPDWTGR